MHIERINQEAYTMSGDLPDLHEDTTTDIDEETTEPPNYNVLLHNDDYTTKAFVVDVLSLRFYPLPFLPFPPRRHEMGYCGHYDSLACLMSQMTHSLVCGRKTPICANAMHPLAFGPSVSDGYSSGSRREKPP